jgi:cystathionine gamma-synthase
MPASAHAVSVALPRWQDVVGYEEGKPETMARISTGYPRFVIHPLVRELAREIGNGESCLPLPSFRTAELCAGFIRRTSGEAAEIRSHRGIHVVATSLAGGEALHAFWQHAGLLVSSRQALALLAGGGKRSDDVAICVSLRQQLANLYDCSRGDVFLTPTGMAAQFAALQAVRRRAPGLPTAQLGFPNMDTLRLQERIGSGCVLLHRLDHLAPKVHALLRRQALAACFCEIPGNPLLGSADLRRTSPMLREHRVPLVGDDVIGTPVNVDLGLYADLIATSLTKFMAGSGDVMGGALICNPRSPLYHELKPIVAAQHEELLWGEDAAILVSRIRGFTERMKRHNQNGLLIAERLREHPAVERVWYPKWECSEAYEAVRRPEGGWGALVSFLPRNGASNAPAIYDRMTVCKGPSLGTVFTLACPFALLACYRELEWAESCGVPRHLVRLSVGLEDPEDLWDRLGTALRGHRQKPLLVPSAPGSIIPIGLSTPAPELKLSSASR